MEESGLSQIVGVSKDLIVLS